MKKQFNMTVELTPDDIKQACADYVKTLLTEHAFLVEPHTVNFTITTRTEGHGPNEEVVHRLSGATVKVTKPDCPYADR